MARTYRHSRYDVETYQIIYISGAYLVFMLDTYRDNLKLNRNYLTKVWLIVRF